MRPNEQRPRAVALLREHGVVRSRDFAAAGITRATINRMHAAGLIARVARGLYRAPNAEVSENASLAEVQALVPGGVICLLSALRFHGLTTQNPAAVWIAVDRKARRPNVRHPPIEVVRFSGELLRAGIDTRVVDHVPVRITSAPRTVADCFRYRNKIGTDIAVEALRDYLRAKRRSIDELLAIAETVGAAKVMRPYLEALT